MKSCTTAGNRRSPGAVHSRGRDRKSPARIPSAAAAALFLLAALPATAHHSFSKTYDAAKPGTLSGTVVELHWINPHAYIVLTVAAADGAVERWTLEGFSSALLAHQGWTKDALPAGSRITASGWPARNMPHRFGAREITFADGSKRFFGPTPALAKPSPCELFGNTGPEIGECTQVVISQGLRK